MERWKALSVKISGYLRHRPEAIGIDVDEHGWASTEQLIDGVNKLGKFRIDMDILREIVKTDNKGRYRFNDDQTKIKACQGHSIPWVIPEMEYREPPEFLYHGTTAEALEKIRASGAVMKMKRHAVHMQQSREKAWQSACRWRNGTPVLLKIDAKRYYEDGAQFGITENEVWCTESVPTEYIAEIIYELTD